MRLVANLAGLASLYLVQGVVAGIGVVLVQVVQAAGGSLEAQAGLLAWGGLPWVLKVVWGLALDRWLPPGSRAMRRVLVASQLAAAVGVFVLARGAGTPDPDLVVGWFVLNALASVQDVAADAFAIDAVPPARRGLANGVMAGARAFGAGFLGTMLIARLLGAFGVETALTVVACACAVAVLPLAFTRPPARPRQAPVAFAEVARSWLEGAFASGIVLGAGILLADATTGAVAWEFLSTRGGWTPEEALGLLSPTTAVAELVAFAAAAVLLDRVRPRRAVIGGSIAIGVAWSLFGVADGLWADKAVVVGLGVVEASARGFVIAGTYALLMDATAPRLRATHFVIFMAMINLARVVGPAIAPTLVEALGFGGLYVLAGGFQVAMAAIVRSLELRP